MSLIWRVSFFCKYVIKHIDYIVMLFIFHTFAVLLKKYIIDMEIIVRLFRESDGYSVFYSTSCSVCDFRFKTKHEALIFYRGLKNGLRLTCRSVRLVDCSDCFVVDDDDLPF